MTRQSPRAKREKPDTVVNVGEAKTHFSRLLRRVEQGEEIVLAKAGKPFARLVPLEAAQARRAPGLLKGVVEELDDRFFEPLPEEELRLWEGYDSKGPI